MAMTFADTLRDEIAEAYERSGNGMGWRLLYSPPAVLDGADIAFIGLNPGGITYGAWVGEFAMKEGSAYCVESWAGSPQGESRLQKQVRALFERLNVRPEDVLAGNLVPYRSPDWAALRDPDDAVAFGAQLWGRILERAKPPVVITMGGAATRIVGDLLGVAGLEKHAIGWGKVSATRGTFGGGVLIGLPHLSRFSIMTREASQRGLGGVLCDLPAR